MTPGPVRIHPAALDEAEAAADWYARRSRKAAQMFLDELEHAIERIGEQPSQSPVYEFGTRRVMLRGFPYAIYRSSNEWWRGYNCCSSRAPAAGLLERSRGVRSAVGVASREPHQHCLHRYHQRGLSMNGIQFITNEKGRKTAAVIDLKKHKELWEDLQDVLVSRSRRHERGIPLQRVKASLVKRGKSRG